MSDSKIGLHPALADNVRRLGFTSPTPIQEQAIPIALSGADLLACAATGSGKTAAFLLPTIQRLMEAGKNRLPRALVVTPTRELAAQVATDLRDFTPRTGLRGTAIFGGVGMPPQVRSLKRGVDVVVATPGRLLDHISQRTCDLSQVEVLVLDEADRMLDMGFLPDIRRIIDQIPTERQTLFFSATMPKEIATLAQDILREPQSIAVERQSAPAAGVRQLVIPVTHEDKKHLLVELLEDDAIRQAICFTRTKHRADRLAKFLDKKGVAAACIHGDRSQNQRQRALDAFRKGRARILVATDIAARGIDIDDLSHVVNFDVPMIADDYIHRVGRTARANREGDAITFVSREEEVKLLAIEKELKKSIDRDTDFEYATDEDRTPKKGKGHSGKKKPQKKPQAKGWPKKGPAAPRKQGHNPKHREERTWGQDGGPADRRPHEGGPKHDRRDRRAFGDERPQRRAQGGHPHHDGGRGHGGRRHENDGPPHRGQGGRPPFNRRHEGGGRPHHDRGHGHGNNGRPHFDRHDDQRGRPYQDRGQGHGGRPHFDRRRDHGGPPHQDRGYGHGGRPYRERGSGPDGNHHHDGGYRQGGRPHRGRGPGGHPHHEHGPHGGPRHDRRPPFGRDRREGGPFFDKRRQHRDDRPAHHQDGRPFTPHDHDGHPAGEQRGPAGRKKGHRKGPGSGWKQGGKPGGKPGAKFGRKPGGKPGGKFGGKPGAKPRRRPAH